MLGGRGSAEHYPQVWITEIKENNISNFNVIFSSPSEKGHQYKIILKKIKCQWAGKQKTWKNAFGWNCLSRYGQIMTSASEPFLYLADCPPHKTQWETKTTSFKVIQIASSSYRPPFKAQVTTWSRTGHPPSGFRSEGSDSENRGLSP